ncbi:MAG: AgmX/PglI C-terminal domain-containing protein [Myxococcota bacterium]|jgi:LPXTG-motif cell wall-anchored protein|nr:AgmX/PglI C-terminal domain-containing protein [Myxococcota bacterium]
MTDSWIPSRQTGPNKFVLFLLVGGALMLAAAVFLFLKRQTPGETAKEAAAEAGFASPTLVEPSALSSSLPPLDTASEPSTAKDKSNRSDKAERSGKIDPKVVKGFFRMHEAELKACYERRLKNNPMLEGKLDLNMVVHSTGKVGTISRNQDTVRDEVMFDCVKRTIRGWEFPKPEGGQVVIAKTFNFKKM